MNTHKGWGICQVAISGGQLPRTLLMRTSQNSQKANFALTEFYEVRAEKQWLSNNKEDSPSGGCTQRV